MGDYTVLLLGSLSHPKYLSNVLSFILQSFKQNPQQFHGLFQRIMEISLADEDVCIVVHGDRGGKSEILREKSGTHYLLERGT